jgi:hypothetical protein
MSAIRRRKRRRKRREREERGRWKIVDMRGHPCEKLDERKFALIVECIQTEKKF